MELSEYLDAITRESGALADAAERAGVDAPVPSCPDWTVADLLAHLGGVQQWARVTVEQRATERISRRDLPGPPEGADLVAWFREQASLLASTLAATDPTSLAWSWTDDRTAAFWFRRQANEAAVHRWDAELASGKTVELDAVLAADGIDESLTMLSFRKDITGNGETVHLHCTDTTGEWLVVRDGDDLVVTREHAHGDVAARGTASDLLRFLWGRGAVDQLEVFGYRAALERFRDQITI